MWNDLVIESVRLSDTMIDAGVLGLESIDLTKSNRSDVAYTLISHIQYRPTDERFSIARELFSQSVGKSPSRQMMTPDQLKDLVKFDIDVGAHTVKHPILKDLSDSEARHEIESSRDWIANVTGRQPLLFAYPNGKPGRDYDQRDVKLVQELGFQAAVSTEWGCATPHSPLFELPRFKPWEKDEFGFAMRLCKTIGRTWL
jgi:hypothetical protein